MKQKTPLKIHEGRRIILIRIRGGAIDEKVAGEKGREKWAARFLRRLGVELLLEDRR